VEVSLPCLDDKKHEKNITTFISLRRSNLIESLILHVHSTTGNAVVVTSDLVKGVGTSFACIAPFSEEFGNILEPWVGGGFRSHDEAIPVFFVGNLIAKLH